MNSAVLCLGSNQASLSEMLNHISIIERAKDKLELYGCHVVRESNEYKSANGYSNKVVEISCRFELTKLIALTKEIEQLYGRDHSKNAEGIVPIDIDVVIFNDEIIRRADYKAEYFKIGYQQIQNA